MIFPPNAILFIFRSMNMIVISAKSGVGVRWSYWFPKEVYAYITRTIYIMHVNKAYGMEQITVGKFYQTGFN